MTSSRVEPWYIYTGVGIPQDSIPTIPPPPPWRIFKGIPADRALGEETGGDTYQTSDPDQDPEVSNRVTDVAMVNAALLLRRPLLVKGGPGAGKSSLAYSVARELGLGPVLRWNITSRATLKEALYQYDSLGRLQDSNFKKNQVPEIGDYIKLGPLGTALLPSTHPRVLLIDEIDKSDIDLPNDLLHIFEEGWYEIPELYRLRKEKREVQVRPADGNDEVTITEGRVTCHAFPFVIMTSNDEREFSPAFLRRCLRLNLPPPGDKKLARIVTAHMPLAKTLTPDAKREEEEDRTALIDKFLAQTKSGEMATDQLMNAVFLVSRELRNEEDPTRHKLVEALLTPLNRSEPGL